MGVQQITEEEIKEAVRGLLIVDGLCYRSVDKERYRNGGGLN